MKLFRILITLFLFSCLFNIHLYSQKYLGTWEGNIELTVNDPLTPVDKLVIDIFQEDDGKILAVTHYYYILAREYEHYYVRGKISANNPNSISLREDSTIAIKLGFMVANYTGTYQLNFSQEGKYDVLRGFWVSHKSIGGRSPLIVPCTFYKLTPPKKQEPKIPIIIKDKNKIKEILNDPKKDSVKTKPEPNPEPERKLDLQKIIEYEKKGIDSVYITLYDNGEVDNDSISVYLDGKVILKKSRISYVPLKISIPIKDLQPLSKIYMKAESIGDIPPCSAQMIVLIGKDRYETVLKSNMETSAMIELFKKE
jgi:hypothetical protein